MSSISEEMRNAWAAYECQKDRMRRIDFGADIIYVAPETVDAWKALECVLAAFGYHTRVEDTDSYNCRDTKAGGARSLHSYGIALDVNWKTNPYLDHAGTRKPRFSDGVTQGDRAQDVKLGKADTDMTRAMIDAVLAIRTNGGNQVFGWGGDWRSIKDAMHFQIEVTPDQIGTGIDWPTVKGWDAHAVDPPEPDTGYDAEDAPDEQDDTGGYDMALPKVFFDTVRGPLFGGGLTQSAVDNMNKIVGYWLETYPDNPLNQLAYVLATVRHEVGSNMRPVREGFKKTDASARAYVQKHYGHKGSDWYCWPAGPHGHVYYGRGFVQLTWLSNYEAQSRKLGIDLVRNPEDALKTGVAIQVLVNGMMDGDFNGKGHGLAHYVNETRQDFVGARRTVNVQDKAGLIAGYAKTFLRALELSEPDLPHGVGGRSRPDWQGRGTAGPDVEERESELADLLRELIETVSGASATPAQPTPADRLKDMFGGSADDADTLARLTEIITRLEKAGVIKPADGLTPINRALGAPIGRLLNGRKTALGVTGLIVSAFLPQLAPFITVLSNIPGTDGAVTTGNVQGILTPLAGVLAGWGGLGKIDKWLHKPTVGTIADLITRLRK